MTAPADSQPDAGAAPERRRRGGSLLELPVLVVVAFALALLLRTFVVAAFYIPSESMVPTLEIGDRVLVEKVTYRLRDPRRGEIIVFRRPGMERVGAGTPARVARSFLEGLGIVQPPEDLDLIKRVIGLPGETIEGRSDGFIYIDGERLTEPYLPPGTTNEEFEEKVIPEGQVFVMGDNRANSTDSTDFGPIDEDSIIGRAFLRIYPLDDIGGL